MQYTYTVRATNWELDVQSDTSITPIEAATKAIEMVSEKTDNGTMHTKDGRNAAMGILMSVAGTDLEERAWIECAQACSNAGFHNAARMATEATLELFPNGLPPLEEIPDS